MKKIIYFIALALLSIESNAQIITLLAGTGGPGTSGDGGLATAAQLLDPEKMVIDKAGNIIFAQLGYIRKISPTGIITTIAGTGVNGYTGDGGPATAANIFQPTGIVIDSKDNIDFVDNYNNVVRKIDPSGIITTIAGSGAMAGTGMGISGYYVGDGGPATAADLGLPVGIAIDGSDNLYLGDFTNNRVRKITPAGIISTIAGNGIQGTSGDGGPATAAEVNNPYFIATDDKGNVYFTSLGDNRVRKIDGFGYISTIAGNGKNGFAGDGGPATAAEFYGALDVAADKTGNVYITDFANYRIRMVNTPGVINTIAGNGIFGEDGYNGPAIAAKIGQPKCLILDHAGDIIFSADNRLKKISADPLAIPRREIESSSINIYPNPANNVLYISCAEVIRHVSVTNSLGQTLKDSNYSDKRAELNISNLSPGIYFVVVNDLYKYKVVKE